MRTLLRVAGKISPNPSSTFNILDRGGCFEHSEFDGGLGSTAASAISFSLSTTLGNVRRSFYDVALGRTGPLLFIYFFRNF